MQTQTIKGFLDELLRGRLDARAIERHAAAAAEIAAGVDATRFCALLSQASRYATRGPAGAALAPTDAERAEAGALVPGWDPERWTLLETARVALVLARGDLEGETGAAALEEAFRYADVGELCALYKSLALLPANERFVWRAGEGCRSNMRVVFEATACDTPYPRERFDELAWNQLAIKAVFVGAPLWRVFGIDERLSPELARMALDLADERRSAGRPIQPQLWLCLGTHGGERALAAIGRELAEGPPAGRMGAALALARAGRADRLPELAEREPDPAVAATMRAAARGACDRTAFRGLAPE